MKLLELYSDYIISSFGQITATGLSSALSGSISHDKITRFLAKKDLDSIMVVETSKTSDKRGGTRRWSKEL